MDVKDEAIADENVKEPQEAEEAEQDFGPAVPFSYFQALQTSARANDTPQLRTLLASPPSGMYAYSSLGSSVVQASVEANESLNSGRVGGELLIEAATHDAIDVARCLVAEFKVDPAYQSFLTCFAPLHYACSHDSRRVAGFLLNECQVDKEMVDGDVFGYTPLLCAVSGSPGAGPRAKASLAMVRWLVEEIKVSVLATSYDGDSVLHVCASSGSQNSQAIDVDAAEVHVSILRYLLELNGSPSIEATNGSGYTCLALAAMSGRLAMVRALVEESKASTEGPELSSSPLYCACFGLHLEVVRYFWEQAPEHARPLANLKQLAEAGFAFPCVREDCVEKKRAIVEYLQAIAARHR